MDVVIVGAHGQIARLLTRLLVARGDGVRAIHRRPEHADDLRADGADPIHADIELDATTGQSLAGAFRGAHAAVFAAGAGPGSGPERKWTVDHGGVVKTIDACRHAGVDRIVIVSAIGIDDPGDGDDDWSVYQRAKAQADADVRASGLHHTIVRPGGLTDDPPSGLVSAARRVGRGQIPRADVAAVLAEVLIDPSTVGRTFEVVSGSDPIDIAIAALAGRPDTHDRESQAG